MGEWRGGGGGEKMKEGIGEEWGEVWEEVWGNGWGRNGKGGGRESMGWEEWGVDPR